MKNMIKLMLVAMAALCISGCNTFDKALRLTQSIEGTGSATVESKAQITTATVENARQEDGQYKADKLDLEHKGKWTGTRVSLHFDDYSRPLVPAE